MRRMLALSALVLALGTFGAAPPAAAAPEQLDTHVFEARTDDTGRFRVDHNLCPDPHHANECADIVGMTVGVQSTVNGTWYAAFSWADEMRWGWTGKTAGGIIRHKDFLGAEVRIILFVRP